MSNTASGAGGDPDVRWDVQALKNSYETALHLMNARLERFAHPLSAKLGGVMGNSLYKYHNGGGFFAAPAGPLFARLFPGHEKIKECYDQAITVLEEVDRQKRHLKLRWQFGIASTPGHYWACARLSMPNTFVHMDAWAEEFNVTTRLDQGRVLKVKWEDWLKM